MAGGAPALTDLVAGQLQISYLTYASTNPFIRAGRLRALAVTTPKRVPQLPNIPTMLEVGMTGYEMTNWYGVMGPANTPRDVVTKLNAEINRIMTLPDAKQRLEEVGTQLDPKSPEQFATFLRSEVQKYAKVTKDANVKID